jgi:short subunit dehydrogenase
MRKQPSGHVGTISSLAGLAGGEYTSAYAASKFGGDRWMESLAPEVEPFGIHTTVVNPGFFSTELLTKESRNYAPASIEDYAERNAARGEFWASMDGKQGGDPAKLAQALLTDRRAGAAAVPVHRRRRRDRAGPGKARRTPAADRRVPRAVVVAGGRRGADRSVSTDPNSGRVAVITGASSGSARRPPARWPSTATGQRCRAPPAAAKRSTSGNALSQTCDAAATRAAPRIAAPTGRILGTCPER